jgi:glycosyltransferase involved in cell wall biosynthesis
MPSLDLNRWAIVGVKDETGLGRMSADLRSLLEPVRFFVLPSRRMQGKPLAEDERFLDPECAEQDLEKMMSGLQGLIFFQDLPHPALLRLARRMGIATVCVPMWEWFHPFVEDWKLCGHFICPNEFCAKVLGKLGYRNTTTLHWPIDLRSLPKRVISGEARVFVHNAGLYEPDDRKATRDTIAAFQRVKDDRLRLLMRVQNDLDFEVADSRIEICRGNLLGHGDLYSVGDVIIQASKAEGLGFGILEAMASGMPVITTNYPPMNEYVRQRPMRVQTRWGKYPAEQTSYIPQAHFKCPRIPDLMRKIAWSARHDLAQISSANRAWAEKIFDRNTLRGQWLLTLENCLS